jgi:hypothetical protein
MADDSGEKVGCGCGGCVSFIFFLFILWAIFFGLPIGDRTWNIDIFPPKIWDMRQNAVVPPPSPDPTPAVLEKADGADGPTPNKKNW